MFALAESPHDPDVLWAGSDDGLIHVTRDGGGSWTEVTPPNMPDEGTVNTIDASPHAPGRVHVAVYNYRMDDWRPFVFRTDDFGATWTLLTDGGNGIASDAPVRVVREDPERQGLLYAGTEFGMHVSFDGGAHWQSLQLDLPHTPVTDLAVAGTDLVVATQGRSFWILDDLTPLRQVDLTRVDSTSVLLAPRPAIRAAVGGFGDGDRSPEAPPQGATLHYLLADPAPDSVTVEILDPDGGVLRTYRSGEEESDDDDGEADDAEFRTREDRAPARAGLNRLVWDLKAPGPSVLNGSVMSLGYTGGAWVPPGTYGVRLTAGTVVTEQELDVRSDPRLGVSDADMAAQFAATLRARDMVTEAHTAIRTLRLARRQLGQAAARVEGGDYPSDFADRVRLASDSASARLTEVEEALIQTRNESGQDPLNFPPMLDNQIVYLYGHVNASYGRPTEGTLERMGDLRSELDVLLVRVRRVLDTEVSDFNRMLSEQGVPGVVVPGSGGARPVS